LSHTVQRVCETRATRHHRDAKATGEFAVGSSHDAGSCLVVGKNEIDTYIARRSNHVEIWAATGHTENAVYPEMVQSLGEVLRQALAHG
jgi:hypothetical protein